MPVSEFSKFLRRKNIPYEERDVSGATVFIIEQYPIPCGKYAGKIVAVGFKIPVDFPDVPPYGIHIKKNHGFEEPIQGVRESELGDEWELWSKNVDWKQKSRTPQHYLAQVNRWLEGSA